VIDKRLAVFILPAQPDKTPTIPHARRSWSPPVGFRHCDKWSRRTASRTATTWPEIVLTDETHLNTLAVSNDVHVAGHDIDLGRYTVFLSQARLDRSSIMPTATGGYQLKIYPAPDSAIAIALGGPADGTR
jgi:hypothetical protein